MTPPLSRARIIGTARRLVEDGAEPLSIRAVARELGVTAPALYLYVENRRDLLAGIAEEEFDRLAARFESVAADDPLDRMRQLAHRYVDHARRSPPLFRLLFRFPPIEDRGTERFAASARVFDHALDATRSAIGAGLLHDGDVLEIATTLWCALHGAAEVILMGFVTDADVDAQVDRVIDMALVGLGAPPDRLHRP